MASPKFRVVFASKKGTFHKCATVWENEKNGKTWLSLSPITNPNPKWDEMTLAEALMASEDRKGFINLYETDQPRPSEGSDIDDFLMR